ncbi:MAG: hypothetical protein M1817_004092 [Caeruleum heppii]|nr:MAG: hypothetical protein M1817_004092 [Caeruleum heppii]
MHFSPRLAKRVLLSGVIGHAVVVLGAMRTESGPVKITGRADSGEAATITIGQLDQYTGTAKLPASQTGLALAIVGNDPSASGIPQAGIDIFLSDELAGRVEEAVGKHCNDALDAKCHQGVQEVLQSRDVQLYPRQLGLFLLFTAVSALYLGVIIPHLYAHGQRQGVPVPVHFGPADLSQISSIGTKTEIHVATATDGKPVVTVTDAPEPSSAQGAVATVSIVTAPSGDLGKGDAVISLDNAMAGRIQDFIDMTADCTRPEKVKRDVNGGCVKTSAQSLIINALPGGPFDALFFFQGVAFRIGDTARQEYVQALIGAQEFAMALAPQYNIEPKQASALGALAFALIYKVYVDGSSISEQNVFPANEVDQGPITTSPTSSTPDGCPTDAPKTDGPRPLGCQDSDCNGDKVKRTCETGDFSRCPCLNVVSYPPLDQYDTVFGNQQATILASVFDGTSDSPDGPWCLYGAAPNQPKEPSEYCQCGKDYATMYEVASGAEPCPYKTDSHPTSTLVFSTKDAAPTNKPGPQPTCGVYPKYGPYRNEVAMSQPAMENAIKLFCSSANEMYIVDYVTGTYGPDGSANFPARDNNIQFTVEPLGTEECSDFDNKIHQDDCSTALRVVTNGCDTDTVTAKKGGYIDFKCNQWIVRSNGVFGSSVR